MDQVAEIMAEAARSVLLKYNLGGVDLEDGVAAVMQRAIHSSEIQRKFAYAVSDKAVLSAKAGPGTVVHSASTVGTDDIPSLRMPSVVRIRQRKQKLRVDHYMPAAATDLFNRSYARELEFDFSQTLYHDHPEAAASRKIETEVVMMMLRSRGADLLRIPSNGYQFSVVDVGGDWRYHHVRKHGGVHVDAPFLDERDRARDARKQLQMTSDAVNREYVCRDKMQDCLVTAPFMMAVHSVLYTTTLLEICESMAARGTYYFVGTMQLPEGFSSMYTQYRDPDYGYVIDFAQADARAAGVYLPPAMRVGVGKYLFGEEHDIVRYTYPAGESRSYEHSRRIILEKLTPSVYDIVTSDGRTLSYNYRIVKRVGSLIYAEIELNRSVQPAHLCPMAHSMNTPFDGYQVTVDENLLRDFAIRIGRDVPVEVPRQLFTAVAADALTRVRDPNYSVEMAISYARSAASEIESNGVIIHKGAGTNRYVTLVVAGLAGFFWAFDRYRLIDARLSELGIADARREVETTIAGRVGSFVGVRQLFNSLKEVGKSVLTDVVTDYTITRGTTFEDMRQLYERISAISTPGIRSIRDMRVCYTQLQPLRVDGEHVRRHMSMVNINSFPAVDPMYEVEPSKRVERQRAYTDAVREGRSDDSSTLVAEGSSTSVPLKSMKPQRVVDEAVGSDGVVDVRPVIVDAITMVEAGEVERDQTAKQIYAKLFDSQTRSVVNVSTMRGIVKGQPTLLHYTMGVLTRVQTLARDYYRGVDPFETFAQTLVGSRAIYPEKTSEGVVFGTGTLAPDLTFRSDKRYRTSDQTFQALIDPSLRVLNASRLHDLRVRIGYEPLLLDVSGSVLADEVAGSGKTHMQCVQYREYTAQPLGKRAAIFASTKAAAGQAMSRLVAWGVNVDPYSISTVDSFLMTPKAWLPYSLVLVDEALQLHAGKLHAIAYLTGAAIKGYGDRKQIGYIPFTRFHKPTVDTAYPWSNTQRNTVSRRIPRGRIPEWLQSPLLYGSEFSTLKTQPEAVVFYVQMSSVEDKLSVPAIYYAMGISPREPLLLLVYTQDEALRVASKLSLPSKLPDSVEGVYSVDYPCCVATNGEAQGEDVDNVLLLRLSSKQEPLHARADQTIVALTRHKRRWAYLAVSSLFPSLVETVAGVPVLVRNMDAISGVRNVIR